MKKILKTIAFVAITALAVVSCQKENLDEQAINAEAQKPALPAEIHITSVEQMPEGAALTARSAATNVTVNDVRGGYLGKLHNIVMNGKDKDDVPQIPIYITNGTAYDTFNFYMPPFRVGSMPGKLKVDIKGITLNSDGTFHADIQNNKRMLKKTVFLDILGGREYDTTLIEGSFTPVAGGYKLELTLESEGSIWFIKIFRAHVEYEGYKQ